MSGGDRLVFLDGSVLITIASLDRHELLRSLRGALAVPPAVRAEVTSGPAAGRLEEAIEAGWIQVFEPSTDSRERAARHLGHEGVTDSGDVALLAVAMAVDDAVVVTDDRPLRETCKALGIDVSGSIGVLIRAVEVGELDAETATDLLAAMDEVGARLSASLFRRAERLIRDAGED